jgi:hypothetical protein
VRLKTFVAISILQSTSRAASAVLCPLGHLADVQNGSQPFYLDTLFCCWPYLRDKYGTALAVLKGKVHDALYKKRIWLEGIQDKTITNDGAKCAFPFVFSLELELKLELQKN